jgi:hypothetical protein
VKQHAILLRADRTNPDFDMDHSEGETAMSRLGNYSEPDYWLAHRIPGAGIAALSGL